MGQHTETRDGPRGRDMSLDSVRPLLFARALARAATTHENADTPAQTHWRTPTRLLGEFVALLALVYVAEVDGPRRPYQTLTAIVFAFFLPNVVLNDRALRGARHALLGPDASGVGPHTLIAAIGVFVCFAAFEAVVGVLDDFRIHDDASEGEGTDDEVE